MSGKCPGVHQAAGQQQRLLSNVGVQHQGPVLL